MNQPPTILKISEILGKPSAVLHSDGLRVYDKMTQEKGISIILSFEGISHCTTAFLNASIGKFLVEFPSEEKILKFTDFGDPKSLINEKIELVLENARQKKRPIIDKGSRDYFYA